MFQSLVITLREGVEATLIIGIVFGYLEKTGRQSWKRIVHWGLAAAILASLMLGYILYHLQKTELGDAYEGWLMLAGAVFVASMVLWMRRMGKRLKQEIEDKLSSLSASPTRAAAAGLFLFVFLMVFREGIETVLFLAAVSLRTTELMNFMGGLIGLGLAIALGVGFFKGSLKVDLRKFFSVTTLVLLVLALQLFVAGVHELSEAQVLPYGRAEMYWVGRFVNNDLLFFVVVIALCLFLVIARRLHAGGPVGAELARLAGPERRKLLAEQQRDRFWKMAATTVGLVSIVLISAKFIYSQVAQAVSPPEQVAVLHGELRIPIAKLADHKLHRFVVSIGGVEVRVIAILDASDSVRSAFDACQICGAQGYYQDGTNVLCRNCGAAIYAPTIGTAGGCNPIHIDYQVEGQTLILTQAALHAGAKMFQ